MLAALADGNPAIEAAFAIAPREAFLGPPPWTAASPLAGYSPLAGADPVVLYQDLVIALDPARGVNNGSPSLHAKLLDALGPQPGEHIVHIGAGAGYYSDGGARHQHGLFCLRRGRTSRLIPKRRRASRAAFDAGGLDTVRSLIWKRPAPPDRCWVAGMDWALRLDGAA